MKGTVYEFLHPALERWRQGTTDNALSEKWEAILKKDPNGKHIVMTIELLLGAETVLRVATQPLEVTSSATGKTYSYFGILAEEPTIAKSYQFGNSSSASRTISLQVPNRLVDVKTLVGSGYMIAGIGEVSLQIDGGDYEDRYVLIRGSSDDGVQFGVQDGEFIQISISDPKETADLKLAPFEIDAERWPKADDSAKGNRYPVVLNTFSKVPALLAQYDPSTTDPTYGQPAITARYLVCVGHAVTISSASAVWLDGSQELLPPGTTPGGGVYNYVVERWVDGKGTPVTMINMTAKVLSGPPAVYEYGSPNPDASVFVEVSNGGGIKTLIQGIQYLLQDYTLLGREGINYKLIGKAEARLSALPISACINASGTSNATNTMQFIEGELLASFPMVSMVWYNGKYGPVVTDRRNTAFAGDFTVGAYPLYDRISDVQESPKSACLNSFTLRYGYDPLEDNYTKSKTLDYTNSALCQLSYVQTGSRVSSPIDSLVIQENSVAAYVLEWMVDHLSFPSYYVEYQGSVWMYFNLDLGDNIRITDEEFDWSAEVATVEKLEYSRGMCTVGLRVWWRYSDLSGAASTMFSFETPTPYEVVDPGQ